MSDDMDKWRGDFIRSVADALDEFRAKTNERMVRFAVDCHPWNGVIALAFLTATEVAESPFLIGPDEMAAWKFYNFAPAPELGSRMRKLYEQAAGDKAEVADRFFKACGHAIASKRIQAILSKYDLSEGFTITIPHPDDNGECYSDSNNNSAEAAMRDLASINRLKQLESRLGPVVESISIRGLSGGPFLFATNRGRAVEASISNEEWWIEFWEDNADPDASPVKEATVPTDYEARQEILDWLMRRT